jgi:predicted nucleotidyltransferase
LHRFFGIKSELETLLGRGVDLIEPGAVCNPFVLASINQHRESIYAA